MIIPFTSSDVWLLVSIALAESKAPPRLADVLFAGDAINKAVFTPQELRRGLSKLTQAGYVNDVGGTYSLTEQGRALVADAQRAYGSWSTIRRRLERRLEATEGPEDAANFEDVRFPYPTVSDEAVDAAVKQYEARFAELLARMEGKDR